MTEVKEAPKPKTSNGQGQKTEVAPRRETAPVRWEERPFAFMRHFARDRQAEREIFQAIILTIQRTIRHVTTPYWEQSLLDCSLRRRGEKVWV